MDIEELEPRPAVAQQRMLDPLSVAELEQYIVDLQEEIERARAAISSKQGVRASADALFGRRD